MLFRSRDRNFAGQLPFLDVLFGTLHMPSGKLPSSYGIDTPMPQNYLLQFAHPFRPAAKPVNQDEGKDVAQAPVTLSDATTPRSSRQNA